MLTQEHPRPSLRKKLSVAGIPESEHSVEALRSRLPDFDTHMFTDTSPDMMAELLLYFIAKGIVTLPVPSDKALLDMPWGSHVCQFYERKEDLLGTLVPFFRQGLERSEACVWVVTDLTVDQATSALASGVPDLDRYMAKGQMQIKHFSEVYTTPAGDVKPADVLSESLAAAGATVMASGFSGLRISGDGGFAGDNENMLRLMDYETKVNCAIQSSRIMAVCTYPARSTNICGCRDLIRSHSNIYVQRGEWVHNKSKDAERIETLFGSLSAMAS